MPQFDTMTIFEQVFWINLDIYIFSFGTVVVRFISPFRLHSRFGVKLLAIIVAPFVAGRFM